MLSAFNISKAYSTSTLFSSLTLNVDADDRIALTGANGYWEDDTSGHPRGRYAAGLRERVHAARRLHRLSEAEPASFDGKPLLQEVLEAGVQRCEKAGTLSAAPGMCQTAPSGPWHFSRSRSET